jgi:uncharacterized protein (DUF1800 family)
MNQAIIAASRFGYGAGPDGTAAIGGDPRGWLKGQLARPQVPASFAALAPSASLVITYQQLVQQRRQAKADGGLPARAVRMAQFGDGPVGADARGGPEDMMPTPPAAMDPPAGQQHFPEQKLLRQAFLAEAAAKFDAVGESQTPFVERLVSFWANHFTVSGIRPVVRPLAGSFEREAIRPHVTGRFEDMVLAVVQHPAMGLYLDNWVSVGPESRVGLRGKRGINENLGRELLELHTLGVDGGYTEQDVRALARILTGWSIGGPRQGDPGHFSFVPQIHEPGPKLFLGQTYPESGMGEGLAAIRAIAHHPSTARHVARQLAVHFIADQPPPAAIERLTRVFMQTGGDLHAVSLALVDQPEAWSLYQQKVKSPFDLVASAIRATGRSLPPEKMIHGLDGLGQGLHMAPSPAGWPDDAASWIGPEAMLRRVQWAQAYADQVGNDLDPVALSTAVLGDTIEPDQHRAIVRAESRTTALAILFASPAFQRR